MCTSAFYKGPITDLDYSCSTNWGAYPCAMLVKWLIRYHTPSQCFITSANANTITHSLYVLEFLLLKFLLIHSYLKCLVYLIIKLSFFQLKDKHNETKAFAFSGLGLCDPSKRGKFVFFSIHIVPFQRHWLWVCDFRKLRPRTAHSQPLCQTNFKSVWLEILFCLI